MRLLVVGAGLAGLTAAIDGVDGGLEVTLLERRPFAGGRTFSFANDAGDLLDNGQHVFLGCCTSYLALLDRLGQRSNIFLQRRLDLRLMDSEYGPARLREAPLPAPLHLLPSFLRLPYLTWREKAGALATLLAIGGRDLPEDESFAAWLARHGQTPNVIRRFWNLIVIPTCNAPAERVSAAQGGFVFREGLLRTRWGGRLGYPRVGLSEVVPERAVTWLRDRGAHLRFGIAVEHVGQEGIRTSGGDRVEADAYVLATAAEEVPRLVGQSWTRPVAGLKSAPIVGVNLWYDRPIFDGEVVAAIVDGEAHWLFDRTRILGRPGSEHHVAVSISAAEATIDTPRAELAAQVAARLTKALPAAAKATLVRTSVEKVRAATFVPAPGSEGARLNNRTPLQNVFLAGSWTNTGWPDTMESAVRSGHAAARLAQDFLQKAGD